MKLLSPSRQLAFINFSTLALRTCVETSTYVSTYFASLFFSCILSNPSCLCCTMWRRVHARFFRQHRAVKLGRWNVNHTEAHIARKAELAAMDNCGVSLAKRQHRGMPSTDSCFDNTMDASLCALQSLHVHAKKSAFKDDSKVKVN